MRQRATIVDLALVRQARRTGRNEGGVKSGWWFAAVCCSLELWAILLWGIAKLIELLR
jgi:hypothetical protein